MASSSPSPSELKQQVFSTKLSEIMNLKYEAFVNMLSELNSIAEYFLDSQGCSLHFKVVNGTDKSFLWKLTVRIECLKVNIYLF